MPTGLKERLIKILIINNIITEEKLDEALKVQKDKGGSLGDILVSQGVINQNELLAILSQQLGIPPISLAKYKIDPKVVNVIPRKIAVQYQIMPISQIGSVLTVAMADPLNVFAADDLRRITGMEINPIITSRDDMKAAIEQYYGSAATTEIEGLVREATRGSEGSVKEEVDAADLRRMALDTPVVKLTDAIVIEAAEARASDILIEPMDQNVRIRYRIDGVFREAQILPKSVQTSLVSRIKVMCNLNIAERRLPQDGRFKVKFKDREVDFRVSTVPTAFGEKMCLRVLDKSQGTLDMEKMGFEPESMKELQKAAKRPHGMILVCGPTGSGKTTTLYAVLKYIDSPQKNFVTVEDPVEFLLPGVNQVNVLPDIGLTYAAALRSILRQDPNVIMVGEIRDLETVDIAIKAALTGHLVLSTLHTNTATGAVMRMMNMGVEPFLISSSVVLVAAQRLIRRICPRCKEQYEVPKAMLEKLKIKIPSGGANFYRGRGCGSCFKTGFKGRIALLEALSLNSELRELIAKRAHESDIYEAARRTGLVTLRECGLRKVFEGVTTLEEVLRVTLGEQD